MCFGIASKHNMGLVAVDVLVDPFGPCGESSFICFQNLEPRVHNVTFLVIVFSAKETSKSLLGLRSLTANRRTIPNRIS